MSVFSIRASRSEAMSALAGGIKRVGTWFAWIGSSLIGLVMVLTAFDALGRYLFNFPLAGVLEISESSMVILVFSNLLYCHLTIGHVSLEFDLLKTYPKARVVARHLVSLIGFTYLGLLSWKSGQVASYSLKIRETSWGSYPVPLYVAKIAVCVGSGLLCIYLVVELIEILIKKAAQAQD